MFCRLSLPPLAAAVALSLALPVARVQGAFVTAVATDPLLGGANGITNDGVNLYAISGGSVVSVPLSGGSVVSLYSGLGGDNITTVGADLFLINANSGPITDTQILRAPKDGSGPITAIYTGSNVGQPIVDGSGLTTDGAKLYSADEVQGRVHSLNPDGSGLTQLGGNRYGGFFDTEHLNTIAQSGGILYVADSGKAGVISPEVVAIPTSGGSFTTLFAGAPFVQPKGIAVGDDHIFITDSNLIWSLPITGGTPTVFASDPRFQNLNQLTFLNGDLYVTDDAAATIWKVSAVSAVPEPSSLVAFGLGLAGLAGYAGWRLLRPHQTSLRSLTSSSPT